MCVSEESPSPAEPGAVEVFIDDGVIRENGVEFEFRDDPVFESVTPQNVIPA